MNRKEQSIVLFKQLIDKLQCPICHQSLELMDEKSLKCTKNHTFDIAKQGYVNLLAGQHKTAYDKDLFISRKEVIREIKFYAPLQQAIAEIINTKWTDNKVFIADVGCGEGSHLHMISKLLPNKKVDGAGIDISKEGIMVAAKNDEDHLWLVGDLANIPLATNSTDVVLDILSPSNYKEFLRILKPEGLMIKIVPSSGYLQEIRQCIYKEESKHQYERDMKIVELFKEHFSNIDSIPVKYKVNLTKDEMEHLLRMTPLTWNTAKETLAPLLTENQEITVDLEILVGQMK